MAWLVYGVLAVVLALLIVWQAGYWVLAYAGLTLAAGASWCWSYYRRMGEPRGRRA